MPHQKDRAFFLVTSAVDRARNDDQKEVIGEKCQWRVEESLLGRTSVAPLETRCLSEQR